MKLLWDFVKRLFSRAPRPAPAASNSVFPTGSAPAGQKQLSRSEMQGSFEQRYQDVLQNIELALVSVYRSNEKMNDHAAVYVVETLVKMYNAELQGRTLALPQFQPHEQEAFDFVKAMCEWRLGRGELKDQSGKKLDIGPGAVTTEEIIACLKRIARSIQGWTKRGGRRGYYEFIKDYVN